MLQLQIRSVFDRSQRRMMQFFEELPHKRHCVLALDYDGTLAPFTPQRRSAVPYPEIPNVLQRIMGIKTCRLVIVTGRRAEEIAPLLGLKKVEVWGCHGLSRLRPDGTHELPKLSAGVVSRIAEANEMLRQDGLFELLEFKPAATAVHWRGREERAEEIAGKVEAVWNRLESRDGLELLRFDGGVEIRVAGWNKGDAIRELLKEEDSSVAVAYLGDDFTDENAFAALNGRGLSVLVRDEYRTTRAEAWIRPPDGVIGFLSNWANARGGAS